MPGHVSNIHVNFKTAVCTRTGLKYDLAGKIQTLHTFNGVNKNNPGVQPNWFITNLWRLSMDGIATGFVLLCFSSWIMWFKIRERYRWGWMVLLLGFAGAGYFVFILQML